MARPWEIFVVNVIKVDDAHRIQLDVLSPGDLYEPKIVSADEITLRRVSRAPDAASQLSGVTVEKREGYSVGLCDHSISAEAIREVIDEFP